LTDKRSSEPDFLKSLSQLKIFTKRTIKELRDTIWAMNQESISLETLQGRMAGIVADLNAITDDKVQVRSDFAPKADLVMDTVSAMHLFRIVQEALNNAVKYSKAANINLIIAIEDDKLKIHVTDNGVGFNTSTQSAGNGLYNINYRASEIGGMVEISSLEGHGTNVILSVPLSQLKADQANTSNDLD
jgi:signal transduction histidine kinase